MKTILFQGDSITDVGRSRENDDCLGEGYPNFVKGKLGYGYPEQYQFINRGNSGNRVVDLYARIKCDIINLKPDYMSILIGINDVWHELDWKNGVDAPKYEKIYAMLIEEIKEALPDIKIVILEPFILKGPATVKEENNEYWSTFKSETEKRAAAAKRITERFNLPFIALQDKFDTAIKRADSTYWLSDGVHPTAIGHELIAREWIQKFEEIN